MISCKKLLLGISFSLGLIFFITAARPVWSSVSVRIGKKGDNENFRSVAVVKGDLRILLTLQGLFEPYTRINLSPNKASTIRKILVTELQKVKRGDILAIFRTLDHSLLVGTAEAQLAVARQKRGQTVQGTPGRQKADEDIIKARDDLEFAESQFSDGLVVAPQEGFVVEIWFRKGENFAPGAKPLISLGDRLVIRVKANQMDAARLKVGLEAKIKSEAFPGQDFRTTIFSVSATGNKRDWESDQHVTFEVVIDLPNPPPSWIKVGMTADIDVLVFHKPKVLKVPREFVNTEDKDLVKGEAYVYRGDPEISEKEKIKVGASDRTHIEIIEGLKEGDEIFITSSPRSLSDMWW